MNILHLDYETFSKADIRNVGGIRYAEDSSTEILIVGYAIDDQPPKVWCPNYRRLANSGLLKDIDTGDVIPDDLFEALMGPEVLIYAHNAQFEKAITDNVACRVLGFPPIADSRWRCTAALGRSLALPSGLDQLAKALHFPQEDLKDKEGKRLIKKFSCPRNTTKHDKRERILPWEDPQDFILFAEYCRQDVVVERKVHDRLKAFELIPFEQKVWEVDTRINFRGFPVDLEGVRKALKIVQEFGQRQNDIFREITGYNSTQRAKVLNWVNSKGYALENLQSGTLDDLFATEKWLLNRRHPNYRDLAKANPGQPPYAPPTEEVKTALSIRRSLGRSSTSKLQTILDVVSEDGRVRGCFVYHKATTGRFAGALVQPHNFVRPSLKDTETALWFVLNADLDAIEFAYEDPMEVVSSCMRHFICAGDGKELVVNDYSSIEARNLVWVAGQKTAVDMYASGRDAYLDMAAFVYKRKYDDLERDYKSGCPTADSQRWFGKCLVLGCGYGMGARAFVEFCDGAITLDEAKEAVNAFRSKYNMVVKLWTEVEKCVIKAIRTGKVQTLKKRYTEIKFYVEDMFLFIELPSGRRLAYPYPKVVREPDKFNRGQTKLGIRFYGHIKGALWGTKSTYGGRLVENIIQGCSRDFMANGMVSAEFEHDYEIILNVHDELGSEVEEGTGSHEDFGKVICQVPDWAEGMPLASSGYVEKRYKKD